MNRLSILKDSKDDDREKIIKIIELFLLELANKIYQF